MLAALAFGALIWWVEDASAGPCDAPLNPVVCENSKPGNAPSEWDVEGAGDSSIQGFATEISVGQGGTVHFKVDTNSSKYRLDIYRMGYYDGDGARKVATVQPSAKLPQNQPGCDDEASTGLIDCGNWAESASWPVPTSAVSGIYFAKLKREDQASQGSHVVFVVRDDDGGSDLLFQTADTTWQAYNQYGGNSLYQGGPGKNPGRAYKVSYNRPLTTRGPTPEDDPFNAEYPMVRWLERNGYEVSYFTGVDADRSGDEILEHEAYLSVGHDEYWSREQRENVEAARDAGVNLAFFSGNEVFWKTRWEDSIDGSGTNHRTLVCYKETHANAKIDPESDTWTGTWRDPRFSADGGEPENALTGTIFSVNSGTTAIEVPAAEGKMRLWRGTSIASLGSGETATLSDDTLGYEWDEDLDNGFRPEGLVPLSSTTVETQQQLLDHGSSYGPGTATHHLTLYRAASAALVFGAGTVQWSWGLDGEHERGGSTPDPRMQQATVNLLADMGVQPGTLQGTLEPATKSTDVSPPTTTIASPLQGADVETGTSIVISGTATDAEGETKGGRVGGVEISTDGGETWHPAKGREQWTYPWTPGPLGSATVMVRSVDDSGNLESPGDDVDVDVVPPTCPCSIWDDSVKGLQDSDSSPVELGVKFRADSAGVISGIRFYKTPGNTGSHAGRLWTAGGKQLALAAFTGETPSGWQTVTFDKPVSISANVTYVAAYHTSSGHYVSLPGYFSLVGTDNGPLHALADGIAGDNGIFKYGAAGGLFSGGGPDSFQSTNYLVDVVYDDETGPDTTAPLINSRAPTPGATNVSVNASVAATFNEAMDPSTISGSTVTLRDPANVLVPATVSYSAAERQLTLDPDSALQFSTKYTATVKGGASGVKDLAGNPLAASSTWSFTTGTPPPPPPDDGPGGPILVISNATNPFSRYYAEILRAEGLNAFLTRDISAVTPAVISSYDVAILGEGSLNSSQVQMLSDWVDQGGNLIAMRPDPQLNGLLGLNSAPGALANAYLKVDTATAPGSGIVGQTIQFHGTANRYTAAGAQTIATLFASSTTSTSNPAVTLRSVGSNGGQAAAFSYDLAKSVVYTRQGNPAWASDERDGNSLIRSDDLFFGAKAGDSQPDWVDLNKVAIPQADEQQRLLTNLIERMNLDRKPLPRFWFLPRDEKAAIVMTGDDHGNGASSGRFDDYEDASPPGCVVAQWECVRSTSYIYPSTPLTDSQAASYTAAGFEIALHTSTNCSNWSNQAELENFYTSQLEELAAGFPSLPAPTTNRTHCIAWSDWARQPKVEGLNGVRFDTNYYYWPAGWVKDRPGMFTGSGMPMRFADLDGSMIDVFQATTQMTDESGQSYPATPNALLDNALGPSGYYGVFTANMHTDEVQSDPSEEIVASAQARGVPVVSAQQMLAWLDGRNQSSFGSLSWAGNNLSFTINVASGANGLRAMLPLTASTGKLTALKRGGASVSTTARTIKGIEYAFFDATAGSYTATYGSAPSDTTPPQTQIDSSPTPLTNSSTAEFKFSGTDTGGSGVASFECRRDSMAPASWESCSSPKSYASLVDGAHSFEVRAIDKADNADFSPATFNWTIDVTAPQTQIVSTPTALTKSTAAEFKFSGTDTGGSGVTSFECRRDSSAPGDWEPCTSPKTYTSLNDGAHAFEVRAIDQAGNVEASAAAFNWSVDTTAPNTQIDSSPAALTNSPSAEFKFSATDADGSGVASLECRHDSSAPSAWESCISPKAYTPLNDGAHSFEVRAIDQAGNTDQSAATFNWSVDITAPQTQVDSSPPALTSSAIAEFKFSGTDTGGSGVASFECRWDSTAPDGWEVCASPKGYASLADGAHSFEVRAIDQTGNADASAATFNWTIDTIAPGSQIDSSPTALTKNESAEFKFSGTDTGGSGVASFECRRDSTVLSGWEPCASPKGYPPLDDGAHSFEVRAIDQAGNVDQSSAQFSWTIDTTAPNTQIDSTPTALTNKASAEFKFSGGDTGGSGVTSFECRLDSTVPSTWEPCASPKGYASLGNGAHVFEVRAIDQAGNVDQSAANFSWTVDAAAPQTQIDASPSALTNSTSAEFKFSGTDTSGSGIVSFECRRDSTALGAWESCSSPKTYTSLGDGLHSFEVRAIDQAGNVDQGAAQFSWRIDTAASSAPTLSTFVPASPANENSPELSGSAPTGSTVRLYAGADCSGTPIATLNVAELATGIAVSVPDNSTTSFRATATSAAGNVSPCSAPLVYVEDSAAPQTQIDSSPTALTSSPTAEFNFSGTDTGGSGIVSFECRRGSTALSGWEPCSSPKSYGGLSSGSHSFEVRATDQAGNADASAAAFTWTIQAAVAPQVVIDSLSKTLLGPGQSSTVSWHADQNGTFVLRVGGTDCNSGTVLDSGTYSSQPAIHASTIAAAAISEGQNSLRLCLTGVSSNPGSATATLTKDTAAPDTQIETHPTALTASTSAQFAFSGSDVSSSVASFQCRRDSTSASDWTSCTSPKTYASLSNGAHTFEVRAIDEAGNVDQGSAEFSWTIDATAPQTEISAYPAAITISTSAEFKFSGTDTGGSDIASFECRRDPTGSDGWAPCTSPKGYSSLAAGIHSFEVRTIDQAGNVDQSPASYKWIIETPGSQPPPTRDVVIAFVKLLEIKYNESKGTALLIVEVPGPGKLTAGAPKPLALSRKREGAGATRAAVTPHKVRARRIEPESVRTTRAGRVKLPVKLTAAGRKLLLENRKVRVKVEVSFESVNGSSATRTMTITLKKKGQGLARPGRTR